MSFKNAPVIKHFSFLENLSKPAQNLAFERTLGLFKSFSQDFLFGRIVCVTAVYFMSGWGLALVAFAILFGLNIVQKFDIARIKTLIEQDNLSATQIENEFVAISIVRFALTGAVYLCFVFGNAQYAGVGGALFIATHCIIFISQSTLVPRALFAGLATLLAFSILGAARDSILQHSLLPFAIFSFFSYGIFLIAERIMNLSQNGFKSEVRLAKEVEISLNYVGELEIEKFQREKLEIAAGVGVYNWFFDDNSHHWSKGAFLALGRDPNQGVPSRDDFLERLMPEDREKYLKAAREARSKCTPFAVEFSSKGDDGTYRHIFFHGDSIFDADGKAIGLSGIVVGQTALKNTLTKASKAQQVLQLALQSAKAVVIEKDYEHGTIKAYGSLSPDDTFEGHCETYEASQEIQAAIIRGLGEDNQQIVDELIDKAEQTGTTQTAMHKYTLLNGKVVDAKTSIYVEGKPSQFKGRAISVTTDVSEDIKRQNQLMKALIKESGAKTLLNMALTSGRSAILTSDAKANIIEIYGDSSLFDIHEGDDFTAQSKRIKRETPREEMAKHLAARKALNQTHKPQIYEYKMVRADKSEMHLRSVLSFAHGAIKNQTRYIAIATDISDEVKRRDEITKALQTANLASRAKSEFLANMSHEIRTPLNGVIAVASVLSNTKLTENQREMVKLVEESGETLKCLLNDILDLARVESGRLEIEKAEFNLKDALQSAGALFRVKAEEKGIGFNLIIDESANAISIGDPTRVKQVASNLLSNAIKFTKKGGVTMKVKCAKPDKKRNSKVTISISDTGMGISEANLKTLFERFEQIDGSITREHGGSGLGLAISRNLAKLMGGDIIVKSSIKKGSTFIFTFMVQSAEENQKPSTITQIAEPLENDEQYLKILCADDNQTNRRILELILAPMVAQLTLCENGKEALDQYCNQNYDVVLMDLQMPIMDGLTAIAKMRAYERNNNRPKCPMIALSANAMAHHINEAKAAGADLHIAKPFTPESLIEGISSAIEAQMTANSQSKSAAN